MSKKKGLANLIISLALCAGGYSHAGVECQTLTSGFKVEKIFEYEGGNVATNKLADLGVSLDAIYPGSFASVNPIMGPTITLFNEYGEVSKAAPLAVTGALYFPAKNCGYYLLTTGSACCEPGVESDGFERAYYTRERELLWEDDGTGNVSGGWVCVSPDGERVVYIKRGYGRGEPNVIFRDRSGKVIASVFIEDPGRRFGFTDDGEYFLLGEDLHSERTSGLGTSVLDKNGVLIFNMDAGSMVSSNTWRGLGVLGGTGKYLYQNFVPVTRRVDDEGNPRGMDPVFDTGGGIQVYDISGRKLWEITHPGSFAHYAAISKNGEYIALFRGFPVVECETFKFDTGEPVRSLAVKTEHTQRPDISISDSGDVVCVSTAFSGNTNATIYDKGELIATFNADTSGYFFLPSRGDFVLFSGDKTLAIYTIK